MTTCFVIMPFGEKETIDKRIIDFDAIYKGLIRTALEGLGLDIIRSDEVKLSGWIHRNMVRHIARAQVCIVDLTTLNPNVFYELGVRHALRRGITVLIKMKGVRLPFNIHGMRAIDYDLEDLEEARQSIAAFVRNGLDGGETDSLVHDVLPSLNVSIERDKPITQTERRRYPLRGRPKAGIGLIGGDIKMVEGIPVWVNSENTNMQMSRFYDRSVSSTIRFLGAKRDRLNHVIADLIADDLAREMGTHKQVPAATVIKTTSGELAARGVKFLLHVAAVRGEIGRGYTPVDDIAECVDKVLQEVEGQPELEGRPAEVLLPLLGTGTGAGKTEELVPILFNAALGYLLRVRTSIIKTVWFLVYTEGQWGICVDALERMRPRIGPPVTVKSLHPKRAPAPQTGSVTS